MKLERAANKTKTWKDKVAKHEGLVRLIQPGMNISCKINQHKTGVFHRHLALCIKFMETGLSVLLPGSYER